MISNGWKPNLHHQSFAVSLRATPNWTAHAQVLKGSQWLSAEQFILVQVLNEGINITLACALAVKQEVEGLSFCFPLAVTGVEVTARTVL